MTATAPQRVIVIGGSSEIGAAILRRLCTRGPLRAVLLGRDTTRMSQLAAELESTQTASAEFDLVDAQDLDAHADVIARAVAQLGGVDLVVHCIGVLGAQDGLDADSGELSRVLGVTFLGAGSLLWHALRALRAQGHGTLMLLSSVAAERPRASNAAYGAAKAGLDALAQGLADGLAGADVRVLVVRPGFVTTRMTAGLAPAPFSVDAETVAAAAVSGLESRASTVWVPGVLRYVFIVLRHLPRTIYRRLPL